MLEVAPLESFRVEWGKMLDLCRMNAEWKPIGKIEKRTADKRRFNDVINRHAKVKGMVYSV